MSPTRSIASNGPAVLDGISRMQQERKQFLEHVSKQMEEWNYLFKNRAFNKTHVKVDWSDWTFEEERVNDMFTKHTGDVNIKKLVVWHTRRRIILFSPPHAFCYTTFK